MRYRVQNITKNIQQSIQMTAMQNETISYAFEKSYYDIRKFVLTKYMLVSPLMKSSRNISSPKRIKKLYLKNSIIVITILEHFPLFLKINLVHYESNYENECYEDYKWNFISRIDNKGLVSHPIIYIASGEFIFTISRNNVILLIN
jgi:hypothetical protein